MTNTTDIGRYFDEARGVWQIVDNRVGLGFSYTYAVTAVDEDGNESWLTNRNAEAVTVASGASPDALGVTVFPNPFRQTSGFPSTADANSIIWNHLPSRATIRIYTASGELVRTLEHDTSGYRSGGLGPAQRRPPALGARHLLLDGRVRSGDGPGHAPHHQVSPTPMPRSFLRLVVSLTALMVAAPVVAQGDLGFDFEKAGAGGFQFLKIALGAREGALGEAAAALSNDANAVFWNVGALAQIEEQQATFTHNEWLVNSSLDAVVIAVPVGSYAVSASLVRFGIEGFEETTVLEPDGTGRMVEAGDVMVGLAASRRFTDRLSIGAQAKYVSERLDEDTFSNVLFDVGALYYTGFRDLRLAFVLQHFGPDVQALRQDFRTPLLFRVAVADDLVNLGDVRVSGALELVHPTDNSEWVNAGVEAVALDVLSVRAGYRMNVDEGAWSFGGGVAVPAVQGVALKADYAYVPFGDILGPTHRFTVSLGL